jgi:hypothetical protein
MNLPDKDYSNVPDVSDEEFETINKELWKGDAEKESKLYYTEMLLFLIADTKIIGEIIEKFTVSPIL